jgi:hypothetical protein
MYKQALYRVEELLDNPVAGKPTLILRSPDFHSITEVVAEPVERPTPIGWWLFFIPSVALLSLLGVAVAWLFWEGIGVWRVRSHDPGAFLVAPIILILVALLASCLPARRAARGVPTDRAQVRISRAATAVTAE